MKRFKILGALILVLALSLTGCGDSKDGQKSKDDSKDNNQKQEEQKDKEEKEKQDEQKNDEKSKDNNEEKQDEEASNSSKELKVITKDDIFFKMKDEDNLAQDEYGLLEYGGFYTKSFDGEYATSASIEEFVEHYKSTFEKSEGFISDQGDDYATIVFRAKADKDEVLRNVVLTIRKFGENHKIEFRVVKINPDGSTYEGEDTYVEKVSLNKEENNENKTVDSVEVFKFKVKEMESEAGGIKSGESYFLMYTSEATFDEAKAYFLEQFKADEEGLAIDQNVENRKTCQMKFYMRNDVDKELDISININEKADNPDELAISVHTQSR